MAVYVKPSLQARNFLMIVAVLLLAVLALSLYFDVVRARQQYEELATAVARSIFRQLLIAREWTSRHGGVYVPKTEDLEPAPNLRELSQDVFTKDGRVLTRIHPEYLTKLIGDIMNDEDRIRIDVTSLKLTSMANAPDLWERGALDRIERGSKEESAIVGRDRSTTFRYMAPLKTEESCLGCHGKQGYRVGDVRGGLAISFSYGPFQKALRKNETQTYLVHLLFLAIGLAMVYSFGTKLIKGIVRLQEALSRIKTLEGLLPICAGCKKIRLAEADPNSQESWIPVESFIGERTDAQFSHGFCPECLKKLYNWEYRK
jgi:two-component system NtrC family sensor kinase